MRWNTGGGVPMASSDTLPNPRNQPEVPISWHYDGQELKIGAGLNHRADVEEKGGQ
jgi:hypothetical protein